MYDTLIQTLAEVDRPGDVCTSGDLPLTMPGLVVEGLGMLRLPLGESQARELVARCRQASQFLTNPEQREIRMPLNKERCRHLHDVIDSNRCDLTHVTERRGRPYTLVCTKTTASYGRDLKSLARIMDMEKRVLAK